MADFGLSKQSDVIPQMEVIKKRERFFFVRFFFIFFWFFVFLIFFFFGFRKKHLLVLSLSKVKLLELIV